MKNRIIRSFITFITTKAVEKCIKYQSSRKNELYFIFEYFLYYRLLLSLAFSIEIPVDFKDSLRFWIYFKVFLLLKTVIRSFYLVFFNLAK